MFKKFRKYMTQKKQLRELTLDTLQKISHITSAVSDLIETAASMSETFDTDAINALMENISKIAENPELTTDYYQQVSRQAHEQEITKTQ